MLSLFTNGPPSLGIDWFLRRKKTKAKDPRCGGYMQRACAGCDQPIRKADKARKREFSCNIRDMRQKKNFWYLTVNALTLRLCSRQVDQRVWTESDLAKDKKF